MTCPICGSPTCLAHPEALRTDLPIPEIPLETNSAGQCKSQKKRRLRLVA
jgi:hypothetical protein